MKEPIYKVLDVMADSVVKFLTPTKWGKEISLKTADQEQLKFLYGIKHPFVYIYKAPENGTKD